LRNKPVSKEITNRATNRKKRILAMPAEADAIPPKPKNAATIAMMRNIIDHFNMRHLLLI
jgi:hypothetical protein